MLGAYLSFCNAQVLAISFYRKTNLEILSEKGFYGKKNKETGKVELQIRGDFEDDSKIIFLISP